MSSILKALRKLEEEKAALGDGGVDIARDILKGSSVRQGGGRFWPLVSMILLLLLVASGFYFVLMVKRPPVIVGSTKVASLGEGTVAAQHIPPVKTAPAREVRQIIPVPQQLQVPEESISSRVESPEIVKVKPEATRANGLPFLKLSGIAYRPNPAERIAIINDLPVMQGTAIEGADVTEILPNRVILEWQGQRFIQEIETQ